MRQHCGALVEDTTMVSGELIRISVLWHEKWYARLQQASRLYFDEGDAEGMAALLAPLHAARRGRGGIERAFVE